MDKIIGFKCRKRCERVFAIELPDEVQVILRHGFQVGISPYLGVGRGIVDAAHGAPIAGIDRLTAEGQIEHVLVVDIPHGIELRINAPFVPLGGVVLLGSERRIQAQ